MNQSKQKKPELLAPAGDFEKLKVAFHFGADAVYVGMKEFSLRANTKNFDNDTLKEAIDYAHGLGKKIFVAMNVYYFPDQAEGILKNLKDLAGLKPDGIIISDPGIIFLMKENGIDIPIHISTQANTTNLQAVRFYKNLGASRVVLARELTLKNICSIREGADGIELEAFIHGAMCIAFSGRCLLSAYMTTGGLGKRDNDEPGKTRSANQGDCSHSCRWEFVLREKTRPDQDYGIAEDEEGCYLLSSKDICMIDRIPDLVDAGIDSFKIEGRMKSILYISSIVRAYRRAIDHHFDAGISFDIGLVRKELDVVSHRDFSTGFFYDAPSDNANVTKNPVYKRQMRLAALVEGGKNGRYVLKIYNAVDPSSDNLELIGREMKTRKISRMRFYDADGNMLEKANHGTYVEAELFGENGGALDCEVFDILRMESDF
jgi:U32 family peptidase